MPGVEKYGRLVISGDRNMVPGDCSPTQRPWIPSFFSG